MLLREDTQLTVVPGAVEEKTEEIHLSLKNGLIQKSPSFDAVRVLR